MIHSLYLNVNNLSITKSPIIIYKALINVLFNLYEILNSCFIEKKDQKCRTTENNTFKAQFSPCFTEQTFQGAGLLFLFFAGRWGAGWEEDSFLDIHAKVKISIANMNFA